MERDTATGRLLAAYRTGGDLRARERLVELYLPLVESFADRYEMRGAEREDLVQVGSIGLLNAIERFDPERSEEFAAFAVPTIAGEIKRHLRDRTRSVRLPRRLEEASVRLPAARQQLTTGLGRAPTSRELAAELGVDEDELPLLAQPGVLPAPDDEAASEDGLDERLLLSGAFDMLDDTERQIVYLRFVRELSRREAATELGMTTDQLRRRTRAALGKLRTELEQSAMLVAVRDNEQAPPPASTDATSPGSTRASTANGPTRRPSRSARAGERSGRILLRMPPPVHDDLAAAAEREGVSLNRFITDKLTEAIDDPHDVQSDRSARAAAGETSGLRASEVPRWLPGAIVANIIVVVVAALVALVLLVIAWQNGW
jgi:RNA polymerase sigma-B factor